jgi:hypothetical protein
MVNVNRTNLSYLSNPSFYKYTEVEILLRVKTLDNIDRLDILKKMRSIRPRIACEIVDHALSNINNRVRQLANSQWFNELVFWYMQSAGADQSKKKAKIVDSLILTIADQKNETNLSNAYQNYNSIKKEYFTTRLRFLTMEGCLDEKHCITSIGMESKAKYVKQVIALISDIVM